LLLEHFDIYNNWFYYIIFFNAHIWEFAVIYFFFATSPKRQEVLFKIRRRRRRRRNEIQSNHDYGAPEKGSEGNVCRHYGSIRVVSSVFSLFSPHVTLRYRFFPSVWYNSY